MSVNKLGDILQVTGADYPFHVLCFIPFQYLLSTGCGIMYVADGNWKLKYPHCMWKVPIEVEGFNKQVNYPNICPLSPERGQAFCKTHCEIAKENNIPHGLHEFLKYCGISGNYYLECKFYYFLLVFSYLTKIFKI